MTAWVLLWAWGMQSAFAISGIESEAECQRLGKAMQAETYYAFVPPPFYCRSYRIAR